MSSPSTGRAVTAATVIQVSSSAPLILSEAMAVQIRSDLEFSQSRLGLATAAFLVARAVVAVGLGRIADRVSSQIALRISLADPRWRVR